MHLGWVSVVDVVSFVSVHAISRVGLRSLWQNGMWNLCAACVFVSVVSPMTIVVFLGGDGGSFVMVLRWTCGMDVVVFLSMSSIIYTDQKISVHRICSDSLRALAM